MTTGCVWIITVGEVGQAGHAVAHQLKPYGLTIQGQRWPTGEKQAWLASADAAAEAHGQVVIVVCDQAHYKDQNIRRELAFFRLLLQTRLKRVVNGFFVVIDATNGAADPSQAAVTSVLSDWGLVSGGAWQAKVVACLHKPRVPSWPLAIGLYAKEKLGVWLSISPREGQCFEGCLLGVSGHDANIDFQAVGPVGGLPEKSVNEYEIKGLEFEVAGKTFTAWGLQNRLDPNQAYYARVDGEPDMLAVGQLPDGQASDVDIIAMS